MKDATKRKDPPMSEQDRERIRMAIQDAVYAAVEAGWSVTEIREEVDYTLDDANQ
jgi:hypothetical protein